jgi:thioesterase domain-containing protein
MFYSADLVTGLKLLESTNPPTKPSIFVDSIHSLEKAMHSLTPISKVMGISVISYDRESLTVTAPLAPNINPHQSAFGGSLFSIAALAGWGLMQIKLSELLLDCNTVVMSGEVSYARPVFEQLRCVCRLPNDSAKVFETLVREGAASTTLTSVFKSNNKDAMRLAAKYHIKKKLGPHK